MGWLQDLFTSDADRANKDVYNKIGNIDENQLKGNNVFGDYKNPFSYQEKLKNLFQSYDNATANQQSRNAEALASQGITGGSIANQSNTDIASKMNQGFSNQNLNMMDQENQDALTIAKLKMGEGQQGLDNIFKKYGLLSEMAGKQGDATPADYIGGAIGSVSNIAKLFI
jgi:hypothetical protein